MNSKDKTVCEKDRAYEYGEMPWRRERVKQGLGLRERTRGKRNRGKVAKTEKYIPIYLSLFFKFNKIA